MAQKPSFQLWPTHWAGGNRTDPINRIHIQRVGDHGGTISGPLLYIEHHGSGSSNDKYPTEEDYRFAKFVVAALNDAAEKEQEKPDFEKPRRAEVVRIYGGEGGIRKRTLPEVAVVVTEDGEEHHLVTGSLNGIEASHRKIGQKGTLAFRKGSNYFLPFFTADATA